MSSTTIHPWPGPGITTRTAEPRARAPRPVAKPPAAPVLSGAERTASPAASPAQATDAADGAFPVAWIPLVVPGLALLTAGSIALIWAWAL